ncbi:uncharacterized protein METZ01_LOCUS472444 [marine metagenome]|uniref:Uncharacterized protein n=1 Tax=marine metagenome TaxID=408172 RepID=A0A383BIE7_9ZZZZ
MTTEIHTMAQCSRKLVVLLNKIQKLESKDELLPYKLDDIKSLARELEHESEFVSGIR